MTHCADRWTVEGGPVTGGWLLDGVRQDRISGEVGWQQKSYTVSGDGTHSLMWQYIKDNRTADGSDRGWVDYLQWTPGAGGASTGWEEITYTYDPAGRRIAKDVDGVVTRYLYDGDHCIAEYACPEPVKIIGVECWGPRHLGVGTNNSLIRPQR